MCCSPPRADDGSSSGQLNFDDSGILQPHHLPGLGAASEFSVDESLSRLSASLQKSTVSQLCNPSDEYFHKWQAMKQKRDARIDREFKRKSRDAMIHSFKQAVYSSEK